MEGCGAGCAIASAFGSCQLLPFTACKEPAGELERAAGRGREELGRAPGWMRPHAAESSDLSVSPTSPMQLGVAAQELIRNPRAAAEPGASAAGATGAWAALAGGSASACCCCFPRVSSFVLRSPRCIWVLPGPRGVLVVQRLSVGSGLGAHTPVTAVREVMCCRSSGGFLQDLVFSHFHRTEQEGSHRFGHRDESVSR